MARIDAVSYLGFWNSGHSTFELDLGAGGDQQVLVQVQTGSPELFTFPSGWVNAINPLVPSASVEHGGVHIVPMFYNGAPPVANITTGGGFATLVATYFRLLPGEMLSGFQAYTQNNVDEDEVVTIPLSAPGGGQLVVVAYRGLVGSV